MKKLLIAVALCSAFAGVGCSDKEKNSPADIVLESYEFDRIAKVAPEDSVDMEGGQYCHVFGSGVLPRDVGNSDIKVLRDSLVSMAGVEYVDKTSVVPKLSEGMQLLDSVAKGTTACSEDMRVLTIDLVTPKVIVWSCLQSSYPCGAAHGAYMTTFLNYDIKGNRILSLSDMFKPGTKAKLAAVVNECVNEQYPGELYQENETIPVSDNFQIYSEGIKLYYSIYSIAPYSSGEIKVELETYRIADILSEKGKELLGWRD